MIYRRKPKVSKFVEQSTAFINGLAEGCKVDETQARKLWDDFARGMPYVQRVDFMMNGHQGGLETAKVIKRA